MTVVDEDFYSESEETTQNKTVLYALKLLERMGELKEPKSNPAELLREVESKNIGLSEK